MFLKFCVLVFFVEKLKNVEFFRRGIIMRKVYLVLIILLSFIIIRLYADEPAFIPERNFLFKTTALTVQDGFSAPCVYDWNKDGRKDLIVGSGSGKIFVYINVGNNNNPEFDTCFPILYKGAPLIIPCTYTTLFGYISDTSDLNGDDLNDLIVGVNNILYFYENTGTASSPQFNTERTQIKLFVLLRNGLEKLMRGILFQKNG